MGNGWAILVMHTVHVDWMAMTACCGDCLREFAFECEIELQMATLIAGVTG